MRAGIIFFVLIVCGSVTSFLWPDHQCERDIDRDRPIVTTKHGVLQGKYLKALNGRVYSAFGSVRYADPPVGNYRFEMARPLTPWQGVKNASELAPYCMQYSEPEYQTNNPVIGVEDCLHLNIFTPRLNFEKTGFFDNDCDNCGIYGCPVIVYIHGGAYQFLGSREYGGKYLLQCGKVIVVTINYRLGPLGFLSLQNKTLPGNIGLKDQISALKYIQENIHIFGGNPKSVTISGMSAGSASVHFMYLSPLSRDLFHRGYGMSGSTFGPWPIQEAASEKAIRVATELDCPISSSQELLDCLKTRPARDIVILTRLFQPFFYLPFTVFGPVIEVINPYAFITKNPIDIIRAGEFHDKPLILSLTEKEGLYPAASYIANATIMADLNNRWNDYAPHLLDFFYTVVPERRNEVSQAVRRHYYGNQQISVENYEPLVQMVGDRHFNLDVASAALLQASKSINPIYVYIFYYRGEDSLSELFSHTENNYGASHADDTGYGMSTGYLNPEKTANDRAMLARFVRMWTTYAISGIPSFGIDVFWPRVHQYGQYLGTINYLEIHSPNDFRHNLRYNFGNRNFWHNLPLNEPTAGRHP